MSNDRVETLEKMVGSHAKSLSDINVYIGNHAKMHHVQDENIRRLTDTLQRNNVVMNDVSHQLTANNRDTKQLGEAVAKLHGKLLEDNNGGNVLTKVKKLEDKEAERIKALDQRVTERRAVAGRVTAGVIGAVILGVASTIISLVNADVNRRLASAVEAQTTRAEIEIKPQATMTQEQFLDAMREIVGLPKPDQSMQNTPRSSSRKPNQQKAQGGKPLSQLQQFVDAPVLPGEVQLRSPGDE